MMEIDLITKNPTKKSLFLNVFYDSKINIKIMQKETPEIQHFDVREIAKFSAKWAADKYNKPIIKMDFGFYIDALEDFPGVFASYIDKTIGSEGIMKLMEQKKNRNAKYVMAAAFCMPNKKPIVESDELKGCITHKLSGKYGWFTDHFFIADGYNKTMGSFIDKERIKIWPTSFLIRLKEKIVKRFDMDVKRNNNSNK
jgi:XTP/dITP diphosphohydrolase